jgi:hypothetical protein
MSIETQTIGGTSVKVLAPGSQQAELAGYINPQPSDLHDNCSGDGMQAARDGSQSPRGTGFIDSVYVPDIRSHTQGGATVGHVIAFLGSGCDRLVAAAFAKEFH